jgi:hypothetical protein
VLSRAKTLGARRSPDGGLSADPGDLSAPRGACGGVPLAGDLVPAGLLALLPLGVGGVLLPFLASAVADLRPITKIFARMKNRLPGSASKLPNRRILHRTAETDADWRSPGSGAEHCYGCRCLSTRGRCARFDCVGVGRCEQQQRSRGRLLGEREIESDHEQLKCIC